MIFLIALIIILIFILLGVSEFWFLVVAFPILFILYIFYQKIPKKVSLTEEAKEELLSKQRHF